MSRDMRCEIIYIIHPNTDKETKTVPVERPDTILKNNGAEVTESKDWEKRRLTYEVNGFREGIYRVVNVTSPSIAGVANESDRLAKINDDIIRYMIVKVEA